MLNRLIRFGVVLCCWGTLAPLASGATIFVQFFPLTGEVRLQNASNDSFDFVFYSLTSPSGALNGDPAVWKSISDNYDSPNLMSPTPGNGTIDMDYAWANLTPNATPNATNLAEGVFFGPGGSLDPYRSVSLGNIWDPNAAPATDIMAQVVQSDYQLANIAYSYNGLDGNYNNGDLVVNALDYVIWKACYGGSSSFCSLVADGNLDGVVNAADYTVWRNHLGDSLTGAASSVSGSGARPSLGAAAAVPEPIAAHLLFAAAPFLLVARRRRNRRLPPRASVHYCNRSKTAS